VVLRSREGSRMTQQHERVSADGLRSECSHPVTIKAGKMARELIEARNAYKYVQHLPGCKIWLYGPACDCGHDQLPEYVRNGGK
jgi:hypothetical protein